jgi:hypothetical protein
MYPPAIEPRISGRFPSIFSIRFFLRLDCILHRQNLLLYLSVDCTAVCPVACRTCSVLSSIVPPSSRHILLCRWRRYVALYETSRCCNSGYHTVVIFKSDTPMAFRNFLLFFFYFYRGATAPSGAKASSLSRIRDHTQKHHTRWDSSGRVISPTQRSLPDNTHHSQQTDIRAPGGIIQEL